MSNSRVDRADIYRMLTAEVAKAGSQAAFAARYGVSRQFVGQVLNGERDASSAMLDTIGVRLRVTRFYEIVETKS